MFTPIGSNVCPSAIAGTSAHAAPSASAAINEPGCQTGARLGAVAVLCPYVIIRKCRSETNRRAQRSLRDRGRLLRNRTVHSVPLFVLVSCDGSEKIPCVHQQSDEVELQLAIQIRPLGVVAIGLDVHAYVVDCEPEGRVLERQ